MFETLTDLGDATLILPASLLLIAYLWISGARRNALAWGTSLGLCIALITLSKIGFNACGNWVPWLDIRSPSGHAAFATMFYGSGAWLLGEGRKRELRIGLALLAVALVAAVAVSRVLLRFHTPEEVAAGLMAGAVSIGVFGALRSGTSEAWTAPRRAVALFIALALLSHGRHVDAEALIAQLSSKFRSTADICTAAAPAPLSGLARRSS